jgi:hypothetical protein
VQRRPTLRLHGWIGKQQVLILLDSVSASTFVSTSFVEKYNLPQEDTSKQSYTSDDGGLMCCTQIVPRLQWYYQGVTFYQDTKNLQLPVYDMILGVDWLEDQGLMWIDWKQQMMKFKYQDREVTLTGVRDVTSHCPVVSGRGLKGLLRQSAITHLVELSVL